MFPVQRYKGEDIFSKTTDFHAFFYRCVSEYINDQRYPQSTYFEPGRDIDNLNVSHFIQCAADAKINFHVPYIC